MDVKIQELTEKIYREGVEKGNEEAERILAKANEQKNAILQKAEQDAERIISTAEKQAVELKKNAEGELKLYAAQFIEDLKTELTDVVTGKVVTSNIQPLAQDAAYMQKIVLEIVKGWASTEGITIQSAAADTLRTYIEANAKDLLKNGNVKLEKINGRPTSFAIVPADGTYKVTFGEDEFLVFFKEFLRPQIIELLF